MYHLEPPHVFVHKRVYRNPRALARLERMLSALGDPETIEVDVGDADRVLDLAGPRPETGPMSGSVRMGLDRRDEDPAFLFNTFVWDEAQRAPVDVERYDYLAARRVARALAGVGEDFAYSRREDLISGGVRHVCQGGWGIHSLFGCAHRCDYCHEGYVVNMMLDLEDFADHVYRTVMGRPQQRLYRYDMYSDSICFEPEYGASAILSETFARTGDKWLLFYTKSDNVEHLLDLPHKSNSIFYLTMATASVCRDIERGTPSMERRIDALRRCQQAGYPVRVGFSPIIPIRNWREEATDCLEKLFAAVRPETVRLWVLSLMTARQAEVMFGDRLDPVIREAMHRNRDFRPEEHFNQPFSYATRAEVYAHYLDEIRRLSPGTPVSLCSERRELWDRLADRLTMSPDDLFCCCGGMSAPPRG